ncbi:tRNA (adenosine(37)-N6)-threonylcarbamoyltransferase complex dimerization subunit type 1 TsaB [Bartonella sp. WD16.2]|uniref:tRNA (adenosine(37)-N6)-threonylcarbamoyltransferase complex dimerization subunit type 1 TsaB n=1 Tax=Bartonella sp. WD16.2 TaxID=1933904 RepID=UPI000999CE1C|nr:tRNA (adenosine(37)-N6)-threonylcarbamoyltransferase complex dimerization subunit type 1 TsaB [Bartonella sp. WD16.2]AQX19180.1 tRNA threonylcarbamoyl adenosine modification protein YeaZ [Bartonella sp. WD16.2]
MFILAIDTASIYCAVALTHHQAVIARISERIFKGHAEKLIGQIAQITNQTGITLDQMNRIAINIGPGSFTGVRTGVSTARALALALEIPAIGVNTLEALAKQAYNKNTMSTITAIIEAGRGMFYYQSFNKDLTALYAPGLQTLENIVADLPQQTILTGPAADIIAAHIKNNKINTATISDLISCEAADVLTYAHLAANKQPQAAPPRPLYLRDADAKQHASFVLPRKNNG